LYHIPTIGVLQDIALFEFPEFFSGEVFIG